MHRFMQEIDTAAKSAAYALNLPFDEVLQEVWHTLLAKGFTDEELEAKGGILYLRIMAKNIAKNLRRSMRDVVVDLSETEANPEELGAVLTGTTDGSMTRPAEDTVQAEAIGIIKAHILEVLASVEAEHREVLEAHYLRGMDGQDIAEALGIEYQLARRRLVSARRALGSAEGDLQLWREYSWPDARKAYGGSAEGGTEALRAKLR